MLDTRQLTGKQRTFIQSLRGQQQIESLRSHCATHQLDFNFIKGFLLSGALDKYVQWQELPETTWVVTEKGQQLKGLLPGYPLAQKLNQGITATEALQSDLGESFSTNYGALRKAQAVDMVKGHITLLKPAVLEAYQQHQQTFVAVLQNVAEAQPPEQLAWLQEAGYITQHTDLDYALTLSPSLDNLNLQPLVTTLTSDLLLSGEWQRVDLKPYNIHDEVADVAYGRPTLLTQCIQRIRDIFLNMGFDEMSGFIVESAFWNFDVLFTPQDHPARDEQDTFYLSHPSTLDLPDKTDFIQRVKQVHETNYGGEWTETEASRAILRAHTTSSTARKLYALQGQPGKYFCIDKVFRNETVDRTHLAEFHQIEGVVIGELLSVRTLMGYLTSFYERLGFQDLKFKPTYNPYTEPSLEVYAYHPPSQKYLEVGNSGLFRPEMLGPLGSGNKSTIAWGLGLERIAMLLYNVEKLSDLVGPDISLDH
jgi:phenylalanyl-tRNA synthetase alpha chain